MLGRVKTKVKFSENIEMDFVPIDAHNGSRAVKYGDRVNYFIENVKGDFEILKLEHIDVVNTPVLYSNDTKTFYTKLPSAERTFELHIKAKMDFQPVVSITRRLEIPKERFEYLEPNQMFIDYIVLSNSSKNVSYKFYGKKNDKENIEIHIENSTSTGVKLNGKTGDFHYTTKLQDIDLMLSFIFEIPHSDEQASAECESRPESISSTGEKSDNEENENALQKNLLQNVVPSTQVPEKDEPPTAEQSEQAETITEKKNPVILERETSKISPGIEEKCPCNNNCHKSTNNKNANDMILITSDAKIFAFHHSFLSKHSTKFAKSFLGSKILPVIININLNSYLLQAALDFLNEKPSQVSTAIVQNELDLFCFADEWDISSLIEASNHKCQENIDESNVCKTIESAFEKDSVGTKNACKKFILENKDKISTAELGKLSQEILSYVFCL